MQFSQLEREMHNSPLKCATNNEAAMASPDKGKLSPKLQAQAYAHASSSSNHASPTKPTTSAKLGNQMSAYSPSPDKHCAANNDTSENARMEDPVYRSPPRIKKFSSPQRTSAMSSGQKRVSIAAVPFGKSIEIIKSKCQVVRGCPSCRFHLSQELLVRRGGITLSW